MTGRFCQDCGSANDAAATTCARCGAVLRSGVPGPPAGAPPAYGVPPVYGPPLGVPTPYRYPAYGTPWVDTERAKRIDRAKWGVLLLAIAGFLAWIPTVNVLGGLLALIGAILVILGRQPFGERHANFVILSVVIWFVGLVPASLGVTSFTIGAVSGDVQAAASNLWSFLVGAVVGGIIQSVAWILFVHEVSAKNGRLLLYAAFVVGAVVQSLVLVVVVAPRVDAIVAGVQGGSITTMQQLLLRITELEPILDLASAPSTILFGVAYFLVYQRITKREIPAPAAPLGAVPWAPSTPTAVSPPYVAPPPPSPPAPPPTPPSP